MLLFVEKIKRSLSSKSILVLRLEILTKHYLTLVLNNRALMFDYLVIAIEDICV